MQQNHADERGAGGDLIPEIHHWRVVNRGGTGSRSPPDRYPASDTYTEVKVPEPGQRIQTLHDSNVVVAQVKDLELRKRTQSRHGVQRVERGTERRQGL